MTLGSLLIVFAAVDLMVAFLLGTAVARRQEELPPDQRSSAPYFIIGSGFATALILCVLAFYLPQADLVIL